MRWVVTAALLAALGCEKPGQGTPQEQPAPPPPPPSADPPVVADDVAVHCSGRRATIDINKADPQFADRMTLDCEGGPPTVERFVQLDRNKPEIKAYEVDSSLFEAAWGRVEKTQWKTLGETCDGLPKGDLYVRIDIREGAVQRKLRCRGVSSPVLEDLAKASEWIAEKAAAEGSRVEVVAVAPPDDLPPGVDEAYAPPAPVVVKAKPLADTKGWKLGAESLGPLTIGLEVEAIAELGAMPKVKLWAQKGLICAVALEQPGVPTDNGPGVGATLGEFREAYGMPVVRADKSIEAGPYVLTVRKPRKLRRKLSERRSSRVYKLKVASVAIDQCEPAPAPDKRRGR